MHGIPVLLKDNIETNDSMHTSAGTIALEQNISSEDAFLVTKLREAGAVIIGKTNMTELANAMSFEMWAGYSAEVVKQSIHMERARMICLLVALVQGPQ